MKKYTLLTVTVFALMSLTGCEAVNTIFKAGMWWGFLLVGAVIDLIIWLFTRGKSN